MYRSFLMKCLGGFTKQKPFSVKISVYLLVIHFMHIVIFVCVNDFLDESE